MPSYTVRRDVQTVATVNAASDGVAKSSAATKVREHLTDEFDSVDVEATGIDEFPAGPFDPHQIIVRATLSVTVDTTDESAAVETGTEEIERRLDALDLDEVEYLDTAQVDAPAN